MPVERKPIQLRITPELAAEIGKAAEKEGRSVNNWIERTLTYLLMVRTPDTGQRIARQEWHGDQYDILPNNISMNPPPPPKMVTLEHHVENVTRAAVEKALSEEGVVDTTDVIAPLPAKRTAVKAKVTERVESREWDPEAMPPDMPDPVHRTANPTPEIARPRPAKREVAPRFKGGKK